jgi:hypothetical protein
MIANYARVINTSKAAKMGRFFAASGKAGCKVTNDKARVYCLKGAARTYRG